MVTTLNLLLFLYPSGKLTQVKCKRMDLDHFTIEYMFHFKNDKHAQASGLGMLMYYFLI